MKVKELKEILNPLPDDMEVILSSDTEGNNYSPLDSVDTTGVYVPLSTWNGEIRVNDGTAPCCLVLIPTN